MEMDKGRCKWCVEPSVPSELLEWASLDLSSLSATPEKTSEAGGWRVP